MSTQKNHKLSISIVIPVYNEQDYIGPCLEAIARQTEMPDEVLVVDNNSKDATVKQVAKYPFAKLLNEPQQGIVFARDRGFDIATGDIIARIDADSLLRTDWCAEVRSFFARDPAAAVTGSCYFYDYPLRRSLHACHVLVYHWLQLLVTGTTVLWGANMALRREAWLGVRSNVDRHNRGHEDVDLSFALQDAGLNIKRNRNMLVEASMLRGDIGPRRTRHYLAGWYEAYQIKGRYWQSLPIRLIIYLLVAISFCMYLIGHPKHRPHGRAIERH
jgi:glycosyltransferase involved in cell wall biosynthesis